MSQSSKRFVPPSHDTRKVPRKIPSTSIIAVLFVIEKMFNNEVLLVEYHSNKSMYDVVHPLATVRTVREHTNDKSNFNLGNS